MFDPSNSLISERKNGPDESENAENSALQFPLCAGNDSIYGKSSIPCEVNETWSPKSSGSVPSVTQAPFCITMGRRLYNSHIAVPHENLHFTKDDWYDTNFPLEDIGFGQPFTTKNDELQQFYTDLIDESMYTAWSNATTHTPALPAVHVALTTSTTTVQTQKLYSNPTVTTKLNPHSSVFTPQVSNRVCVAVQLAPSSPVYTLPEKNLNQEHRKPIVWWKEPTKSTAKSELSFNEDLSNSRTSTPIPSAAKDPTEQMYPQLYNLNNTEKILKSLAVPDPTPKSCSNKQYEFCKFCYKNGELSSVYISHVTKLPDGTICCPILRKYICDLCGATGNYAHTRKYCPLYTEQNKKFAVFRRLTNGVLTSSHNHK